MVLLNELDECIVEVEFESSANLNLVIWNVWMDEDIVQLIHARLIRFVCSTEADCNCYKVEGLAFKVLW